MSHYRQTRKQDVENINAGNFLQDKPNEELELFNRALSEVADEKIRRDEKEPEDTEIPPQSRRHKIQMNRLFRERVGGSFIPFPEEDNLYERVRSKLVIKFKINQYLNRRKERKRARQKSKKEIRGT